MFSQQLQQSVFHLSKRSVGNIRLWGQNEGTKLVSAPALNKYTGRNPSHEIYRWGRFTSNNSGHKRPESNMAAGAFLDWKLSCLCCLPTNGTPTGRYLISEGLLHTQILPNVLALPPPSQK